MKNTISFLCRFPGIFLITLIGLTVFCFIHWENLDGRQWLPIIMSLFLTFVANLYLFFIQGEKLGQTVKGSKWIPIILIGLLTVVCILGLISFQKTDPNEFPGDYAVQAVLWKSTALTLGWAWFSLFWNISTSRILENNKLLEKPSDYPMIETEN